MHIFQRNFWYYSVFLFCFVSLLVSHGFLFLAFAATFVVFFFIFKIKISSLIASHQSLENFGKYSFLCIFIRRLGRFWSGSPGWIKHFFIFKTFLSSHLGAGKIVHFRSLMSLKVNRLVPLLFCSLGCQLTLSKIHKQTFWYQFESGVRIEKCYCCCISEALTCSR